MGENPLHINPNIMEAFLAPVGDLVLNPENNRDHDEANLQAIVHSLQDHGQQTPIVIDGNRVVQKGNGTLIAAQRIGATHIACVATDIQAAEEILAYATRDNRTGELAAWIYPQLALDMRRLIEAGTSPERLGWAKDELEPILQTTWRPPDEPTVPAPGFRSIALTEDQWQIVEQAVNLVRIEADDMKMKIGRAVELMAGDFIAGRRPEG